MFGPVQPQHLETTQLVRACLVGAVIHSSWQWGSDETSSAPAIDALWETLQETRGLGHPAAIGRVCAPMVRAARIRDLVSWNDRLDQTQQDVLALVNQTIARMTKTTNTDQRIRPREVPRTPRVLPSQPAPMRLI